MVRKGAHMSKIRTMLLLFYLDGWGKTGRIYPIRYLSIYLDGLEKCYRIKHYTRDGKDDSFTEICFPEYEGCGCIVGGGKIMSICLVKD